MEKLSTPPLQITDRFGAQAAFASLRLPDGTEATVPAEHAAAIYVNEQPAFRVVCTPALLPQLALGRLLTEGWIASADEVEQIAVCAEGAKVQVYLRHPLPTRNAAAQEVAVLLGPGLNTKRSPLCWLAWAVLHTLLKRSSREGTPDLNLLFQYNMPVRALAQMTGGMVGQETVDGIVMEAKGFWIIGLLRALIGFGQNAVSNRKFRAALDAERGGPAV